MALRTLYRNLSLVVLLGLSLGCSRKPSGTDGPPGEKKVEGPSAASPVGQGTAHEIQPPQVQPNGVQPTEIPTAEGQPPGEPASPIVHISGPALVDTIAKSGFKGTLVNAWASWCGPCRREFPMLISLRDSLASQKLDVLFVAVDEPETEAAAHEFASQRGLSAPIWVAERPLGPFKQALNPNWPGMLPATFLFDDKGKLRYFWGGPVYEQELLPVIEGFLSGKDIDGQANFGLRRGKDFRGE